MVGGKGKRVVLVTCGSMKEAREIARAVVEKRLAACVNIGTAPVESVYRRPASSTIKKSLRCEPVKLDCGTFAASPLAESAMRNLPQCAAQHPFTRR